MKEIARKKRVLFWRLASQVFVFFVFLLFFSNSYALYIDISKTYSKVSASLLTHTADGDFLIEDFQSSPNDVFVSANPKFRRIDYYIASRDVSAFAGNGNGSSWAEINFAGSQLEDFSESLVDSFEIKGHIFAEYSLQLVSEDPSDGPAGLFFAGGRQEGFNIPDLTFFNSAGETVFSGIWTSQLFIPLALDEKYFFTIEAEQTTPQYDARIEFLVEVRDTQNVPVPEPSTLLLFGFGFGLLIIPYIEVLPESRGN